LRARAASRELAWSAELPAASIPGRSWGPLRADTGSGAGRLAFPAVQPEPFGGSDWLAVSGAPCLITGDQNSALVTHASPSETPFGSRDPSSCSRPKPRARIGIPLLGFIKDRPSASTNLARPLPENPKALLRREDANLRACSALAVPPGSDGLLRARPCGSIAPRNRPWGSPHFRLAAALASKDAPLAARLPKWRFQPFEAFPSATAAPRHRGRCPLAVASAFRSPANRASTAVGFASCGRPASGLCSIAESVALLGVATQLRSMLPWALLHRMRMVVPRLRRSEELRRPWHWLPARRPVSGTAGSTLIAALAPPEGCTCFASAGRTQLAASGECAPKSSAALGSPLISSLHRPKAVHVRSEAPRSAPGPLAARRLRAAQFGARCAAHSKKNGRSRAHIHLSLPILLPRQLTDRRNPPPRQVRSSVLFGFARLALLARSEPKSEACRMLAPGTSAAARRMPPKRHPRLAPLDQRAARLQPKLPRCCAPAAGLLPGWAEARSRGVAAQRRG
jgi:hypothetical protein